MVKGLLNLTEFSPRDVILWAFVSLALFILAGVLYFIGPLLAIVITAFLILGAILFLLRIAFAFATREVNKHIEIRRFQEEDNEKRIL